MNFQEKYRIGMFRDTGMTPLEIAKQLHYMPATVQKVLAEIDEENTRVHHFCSVGILVRIWDTTFKSYVNKEFEVNVDLKSVPYQEAVNRISASIQDIIESKKSELL
jgi:hypothetical protein